MIEKSISDVLNHNWRKVKVEKPIEEKAPDPIVVSEIEPQPKETKRIIEKSKVQSLTNDTPTSNWISGDIRKSQNKWDGQILKLEAFFNSIDLPTDEIRLSPCSVITDVQKFITSNLLCVKRYNGNMTFEPYLMRLEKLKNILSV